MLKTTILSMGLGVQAKIYFSESFDNMDKWVPSKWKTGSEMGEFKLGAGQFFSDKEADKSLWANTDHRFYGTSASFDPFSNEDKTLIVQYQVKYDKDIECGGGYLKLGPKLEDPEKFGDPTPYNIMFGPDKCGYTKRTHLIFNYKGKNALKKTDLPYKQDKEKVSVLYRLVLKPDSTVEVFVDKESIYSGSLESDWELLPEKEIDDPEDKKPEDWVDEEKMDDPEDKKPDDWVEEAKIKDPKATKPEDWDDEEDGEWEAPLIDNAEYKGEWKVKRIDNPAYKGVWEPKKIPNPEYEADVKLYSYKEFGFVGFDLWQVKSDALFDNIVITDDVAEADEWAAKWETLSAVEKEKAEKEAAEQAAKDAADKPAGDDAADSDVEVDTDGGDSDKDDDEDL